MQNGEVFTRRFNHSPVEVAVDTISRRNGKEHLLSAPRSPSMTCKIERFHRMMRAELVTGTLFTDVSTARASLDDWVALTYVVYLALSVVLWRVNRSAVAIAVAFCVLGMAAYMSAPRPVEMPTLTHSYADTATRTALLATGDGKLATWMGTAFDVYHFFNRMTLAILAIIMLRSSIFSRGTAVSGPEVSRPQNRPHQLRDGRPGVRGGVVGTLVGVGRSDLAASVVARWPGQAGGGRIGFTGAGRGRRPHHPPPDRGCRSALHLPDASVLDR